MNYHTGAQQRQAFTDDQFEDVFDERGILKDGKGFRTSMFVMDSVQRAAAANRSHAFGLDNAPASGERYEDAADNHSFDVERNTSEREKLYADAEARLCSAHLDPYAAWRDPSPAVASEPQPTNDEQKPPATLADAYAAYETRLTTAYKNPPAMAPIVSDSTPRSLLPPPSSMMTDERERLYAKRNEAYENAWKNPL